MLRWFRVKISNWVERATEREIKRLTKEAQALKAEVMALNGGKPIALSPKDREYLRQASKNIDPQRLKEIMILDLDECESEDKTKSQREPT